MALAVNATSAQHWVCFADMNRMSSQWARGGGAACWRHAATYAAILSMVTSVEACP